MFYLKNDFKKLYTFKKRHIITREDLYDLSPDLYWNDISEMYYDYYVIFNLTAMGLYWYFYLMDMNY